MMRGPRTAMKSGPHLPQLEKALAQKRRPNTAINKERKKERILVKKGDLLKKKNPIPIHNKNSQQTRNTEELPQLDREHLKKLNS